MSRILKAQAAQAARATPVRLTLIVDYELDNYDQEEAEELVRKANETGTVKVARLENLPSTVDLAKDVRE